MKIRILCGNLNVFLECSRHCSTYRRWFCEGGYRFGCEGGHGYMRESGSGSGDVSYNGLTLDDDKLVLEFIASD